MTYTVTWRKLPSKEVIRTETYADLDEAKDEAYVLVAGPAPIEITVQGDDGVQHFLRVVG